MLLSWISQPNWDGNGNTRYWSTPDDAKNNKNRVRVYGIEPMLRNDSVVYEIDFTPDLSDSQFPQANRRQRTLQLAQATCEQYEAEITNHTVTAREVIQDWAADHQYLIHIDPEQVFRYSVLNKRGVGSPEIKAELDNLVSQGKLKQSFGVLAYGGSFGHSSSGREFWSSVNKIPKALRETDDTKFRTEDGEIVVVYQRLDEGKLSGGIY